MKLTFIVNEQAGSGKAALVWQRYSKQLSVPYELHYTKHAGHAIEIARSYAVRCDQAYLLVAVGGDGTIHEVIEGAAGYEQLVIGVLKAGSGNDFARGYTIFTSIDEVQRYVQQTNDIATAANSVAFTEVKKQRQSAESTSGKELTGCNELMEDQKLAKMNFAEPSGSTEQTLFDEAAAGLEHTVNDLNQSQTAELDLEPIDPMKTGKYNELTDRAQSMDLGRVEKGEQRASFVNSAGIGFDAYVAEAVNRSGLKRVLNAIGLGKLIYVLMAIWGILRFKRFDAVIEVEGKSYDFSQVWFIVICNQPFFGGGMKISPQSITSDNRFELTVVHNLSRLKLLMLFMTVFFGKHERFKEVTMLKGEAFAITLDACAPIHVDGESLGQVEPRESVLCSIDERKWKLATMQ